MSVSLHTDTTQTDRQTDADTDRHKHTHKTLQGVIWIGPIVHCYSYVKILISKVTPIIKHEHTINWQIFV